MFERANLTSLIDPFAPVNDLNDTPSIEKAVGSKNDKIHIRESPHLSHHAALDILTATQVSNSVMVERLLQLCRVSPASTTTPRFSKR